jgi:hypothetical protein
MAAAVEGSSDKGIIFLDNLETSDTIIVYLLHFLMHFYQIR